MKMMWRIYVLSFIVLFTGYYCWIQLMHSTFNLFSITGIVLPLILLIALYMVNRKAGSWATHTALVICVTIFAGAVYQLWVHEQKSHFTMVHWVNEPENRVWMVDDLLAKYDFVGMDALSIESILGKETETSYFEAPDRSVYYLGNERGFISIDSEWLVFDFDEQDRVTNVEIMRD
ncbi:hypothetical protein QPK24_12995 [Paenibacillus polygoni]|uniref:Uncharacterized protein n=1 Tax=Paenibacillus polygoni TaxID=3050112 RepID=A0ABY8WYV9_9BACL|nr:hypothetical protein [Paenibacillus polygoni]WIV17352.1 hypothetical protein QPK24_12995 [Paenibacillus polygoni]